MNKEKKTAEQIQNEKVANSPVVQWMMRYVAYPTLLLLWLQAFEMFTYAWDPDFMGFVILISSSFVLFFYIPVFFLTKVLNGSIG